MKYKLLPFFLFFFIILTSLTLTSSSSVAGPSICHTIDGKIVIGSLDNTPVSHDGGTTFNKDNCEREPLFYKLNFYKVLFCTTDLHTSVIIKLDLSVCEAVLLNSEKEVVIQPGVESAVLDGEDLLLPVNNYGFVAVVVGNHVAVKHYEQFVDANGDDIDLSGIGSSSAFTEGNYCFSSADKATTYTGTNGSGSGGHGTTPHVASDGSSRAYLETNTQDPRTMTMKCIDSVPQASDGYGYSYEIIDSMDKRGDFTCDDPNGDEDFSDENCSSTFGAGEPYFDPDSQLGIDIGGEAAFNLLQNNLDLATNRANATKISYIMKLDNPIIINEFTSSIKMEFGTSKSVSVDFNFDSGGSATGRDNVQALKMGANPFFMKFYTKTKRRGRSRDWR
jgi:hypothetical protein